MSDHGLSNHAGNARTRKKMKKRIRKDSIIGQATVGKKTNPPIGRSFMTDDVNVKARVDKWRHQ